MPADTSDWNRFIDQLEAARKTPYRLYREAAHALAARMLGLVIPRTPKGEYSSETGKVGGTLQRGWTVKSHSAAASNPGTPTSQEMQAWADSLPVRHKGDSYEITVTNPVEYASYVEYGHRQTPGRYVPAIGKRLKKRFVEGQHMMLMSAAEINSKKPQILEKVLQEWLERTFENGE